MNDRRTRLEALQRETARLERRLAALEARSGQYSGQLVMIFIGGSILTIVALTALHVFGFLFTLAAIIAFILTLRNQSRVGASLSRYRVWVQLKKTQLARMQLNWEAIPAVAERSETPDHPFEVDLDITGDRSLLQLINTGVSIEGVQRLRDWLLATTPDLDAIQRRQALLRELTSMNGFRNKLLFRALYATRYGSERLRGEALVEWLKKDNATHIARAELIIPTILSGCFFAALLLYIVVHVSVIYCIALLLLSLFWFLLRGKKRGNLFGDAHYLRIAFERLNEIFSFLETYHYGKHAQLRQLCEPFYLYPDYRPSILMHRLAGIAKRSELEGTEIIWLIVNAVIPLGFYLSYQLQECKKRVAKYLPAWLDVWYELEALCSLANFAYLNPDYTLPTLERNDQQEQACTLFEARRLGHPLLQPEEKVVNDVSMHDLGEVMLITGSNMAGKSTFLRTLGINLCLAYAGGPVNAASLRTALFRIYSSIKVSDSIADGYSYFYAEVRRLKALLVALEQADQPPLFFLIDEIYRGTNNRERLIGSRAYVRTLVGQRCVGAISTHDLELVTLSELFPAIKNYHFREEVRRGKMLFDYRLRPGPCPTTNALKIMRLEGLPVE
jgi:hypothetical protein